MLKEKTVFVIGAGASAEFGLPTGNALKSLIAAKLNFSSDWRWFSGSSDSKILQCLRNINSTTFVPDERFYTYPDRLISAARTISNAMPIALSIDNFLHTHNANPEIVTVGKIAIAQCILDAERASNIFYDPSSGHNLNLTSTNEIWLNLLCQTLFENTTRQRPDDFYNNLCFVTFNYDRCIEHYLVHAVKTYYDINNEEAQSLVQKIPIYHPYGQVGLLPWQGSGGVSFGENVLPHRLTNIADQIRVFTEGAERTEILNVIRSEIASATCVVYLGFSYGKMNLDLISTSSKSNTRQIIGSTYNMSAQNVHAVKELLRSSFFTDNAIEFCFCNEKCYKTLEDHLRIVFG